MIRVLLADDHAIVLEGLRALLEDEADLKVVAWTTDGTEVVTLVQQYKPDVVVLDLELTSIKGTEVIAALRDRPSPPPAPKVLVLTAYNDGDSLRSALDAGADGLALKTESPQQTITAIRQVYAGQLVFPQAARRWIEGRSAAARGDLTPREREVWALVAGGLTNPQIAERLGLSDNTVKFHVQHLFTKLGVKNRTEAALKYAHGAPSLPFPPLPPR
jgi:DNA-binding NarL/FixJ family response regulator